MVTVNKAKTENKQKKKKTDNKIVSKVKKANFDIFYGLRTLFRLVTLFGCNFCDCRICSKGTRIGRKIFFSSAMGAKDEELQTKEAEMSFSEDEKFTF